jgi:hypothetical protein
MSAGRLSIDYEGENESPNAPASPRVYHLQGRAHITQRVLSLTKRGERIQSGVHGGNR